MYNDMMNNIYDPYTNKYYNQNSRTIRQYEFVNGIEGAKSYPLQPGQSMMLMDADASICYMKGAKSYPLQPGQSMMLMDADASICYMKVADSIGKCSLRYFELNEIDEATAKQILEPTKQTQPTENYASKSDIDAINKRLDELFKRLENKSNKKDNNG